MTGYLLDTNVISETIRRHPETRVMEWLRRQPPSHLFLAAPTVGELVHGARLTPDGERKTRLEIWIDRQLSIEFKDRVLSYDTDAAVIWGELMADGERRGRPASPPDAQIAAIALLHGLTVVTRNEKDFAAFGAPLLNPWTAG